MPQYELRIVRIADNSSRWSSFSSAASSFGHVTQVGKESAEIRQEEDMTTEESITSEGAKKLLDRSSSREWEESEWFQKWLEMNRQNTGAVPKK